MIRKQTPVWVPSEWGLVEEERVRKAFFAKDTTTMKAKAQPKRRA